MKERPMLFSDPMVRAILDGSKTQARIAFRTDGKVLFGKPGDLIWVRETFTLEHQMEYGQKPPFDDGRPLSCNQDGWVQPHYRSTDPKPELDYGDGGEPECKWKPSIHMPRWASRITMEITDVRVEQLHDISEGDAKAEGVKPYMLPCHPDIGPYKAGYSALWISIHGDDSWDSNLFVRCISFKRIK